MYISEIKAFEDYLISDEKSKNTIDKYIRDVRAFADFLESRELTKNEVLAYKEKIANEYAPASVNSMLVAINCFLQFIERSDCVVKLLKIQRQIFCNEDKELTKAEYQRLVRAARDTQIAYILQTICATGIRVSELKFITVEAVEQGVAVVNNKNKMRTILIPKEVRTQLKRYINKSHIKSGSVFVTKNGKPLDRSNIWRKMKALCIKAKVPESKVFPHNLRHLFARLFYSIDKDIVRLADILGHSSIETTRIYTIESGRNHRLALERLQRLIAFTT